MVSKSKLSKAERARIRARIRQLESKTASADDGAESLTDDELLEYCDLLWTLNPESMRAALEDALIDRGLTNRDLFEMLQKAKQRAKH